MKKIVIQEYPDLTTPVGRRVELTWKEMTRRCTSPRRAAHTMEQYAAMNPDQRRKAKATAAFLGARSCDGRRKAASIEAYTLICLDMDHCPADAVDNLCLALIDMEVQAVVYSTHSSRPFQPRLRLIINPDREMTADEYRTVCRHVAGELTLACGAQNQEIPMFDPSAWASAHVFFWPTCPADAWFVNEVTEGRELDVDAVLEKVRRELPAPAPPQPGQPRKPRQARSTGAGTPADAFNAAYTVERAIAEFLGDVYSHDAASGRYTYRAGEGEGGLVLLDSDTAFSHHGSDPACGHRLSAYMLVAVHRHGVRPGRKNRTALKAMDRWVMTLPEVRQAMAEARGLDPSQTWKLDLVTDKEGNCVCSRPNVGMILRNDPQVAGTFYMDTFAHRLMYYPQRVFEGMDPDNTGADTPRAWEDMVDARLRYWLEQNYGITGREAVTDALLVTAQDAPVHPVRDYLESLVWDGTPRAERVFIDFLGADNNELNQYFTRMFLVGAVARVMNPGCKFDYCPVLCGRQGIGKSMVLSILGGAWFTDALMDLRDKDGLMVIQGRWIVELGELKALKRAEDFDAKSFLTILEDRFRPPYGRYMVDYPRQCVFAATTNEEYFLKSSDGNRRFVPVHCHGTRIHADVAHALKVLRATRDQIWAEAVELWRQGMELFLPRHLEEKARFRQAAVNENVDDPLRDALSQFISTPRPADWYTYSVAARYSWYHTPHTPEDLKFCQLPDRVSVPEVLQEVVGARPSDRDYYVKSRKLGQYLKELEGWTSVGSSRHTNTLYNGMVRAWERRM